MNEIIQITKQKISGSEQNAVNARELHKFLESKRQFSDWIKQRIADYDFIKNQDFVSFSQICENGGRRIEYFVSLDMAKELAMLERNTKGKQARRYFIECEKRLLNGFQAAAVKPHRIDDLPPSYLFPQETQLPRPPRNLAEARALFTQIDEQEARIHADFRDILAQRAQMCEILRKTQAWREYWLAVEASE